MEQLSRIYSMLSDRNRLRILKLLESRPMCVCELTCVLGIRQPSVSRHLKKLKETGLVGSRTNSCWQEYFIAPKRDEHSRITMKNLSLWLNDHPVVIQDLKKAAQADRRNLCSDVLIDRPITITYSSKRKTRKG